MLGLFAMYKCLSCNHEFVADPGPQQCQACKHVYLEWINYSEKEFKDK